MRLCSALLRMPNKRQSNIAAPSRNDQLSAEFDLDFYRKLCRSLRFPVHLYWPALSRKICFFLSTKLYSSAISMTLSRVLGALLGHNIFPIFPNSIQAHIFPGPQNSADCTATISLHIQFYRLIFGFFTMASLFVFRGVIFSAYFAFVLLDSCLCFSGFYLIRSVITCFTFHKSSIS